MESPAPPDAPMAEPVETTEPIKAPIERKQARVSDFSRPCDKGDKCWLVRRPLVTKPEKEGCLLVKLPSRLYDALCNYWSGLSVVPQNFPAEQDPDTVEINGDKESTKLIPAWVLGHGQAEVEVSVDTIWRAFRGLDVELGGTTVPTTPMQQEEQEEQVEHSPALYLETVLKRMPDALSLIRNSPGFSRVPVHQSQSREHQFYDWCRVQDNAFINIEDCYMQMHPSVVEQINPSSGAKHIWQGFPADTHIIGLSGTGKLYVVARETPKQRYRIFRLDVTVPDEQIKDGLVMVKDQKDGKEKPEVDPSRVWPRFQEVTISEGALSFAQPPILTAVSSQTGLVTPDMLTMLFPSNEKDEYDLVIVLLPVGARPVMRSVVSPTRGYIPSMLAVSTQSAAVLCVDAKDHNGEPYPPHVWIIPLDPTSSLDDPEIHSQFTISGAVPIALRAPVMDAGEESARVSFSCMVYDELDPHALLIGTTDGGAVRYHVKVPEKTYMHPTAVYFSHSTPREIEIANRSIEREKALENVGRMRKPVLWMQASNTTLGGTRVDESADVKNIFERTGQRITSALTTGHAWSLGDRTRLANENLFLRKIRPFESRVTDAAARCCISRGSTMAVHIIVPDSLLLADMRSGLVIGSIDNPNDPSVGRVLKPGETINERAFSSLWMDLGRVVVCHTSGNVSFVRRATAEMLAERDKQRKARQAEHEERMKKLEEDTAKLSVSNSGGGSVAVDAKRDEAMTDQS